MSRQASILTATPSNISTNQTDFTQSISTGASGAVITVGKYRLIAISTTVAMNVSFGLSTNIITPTASFYLIPAGAQTIIDLGPACDSVQFFNNSGGTGSVFVKTFSVN